jgi:hypothetical protein
MQPSAARLQWPCQPWVNDGVSQLPILGAGEGHVYSIVQYLPVLHSLLCKPAEVLSGPTQVLRGVTPPNAFLFLDHYAPTTRPVAGVVSVTHTTPGWSAFKPEPSWWKANDCPLYCIKLPPASCQYPVAAQSRASLAGRVCALVQSILTYVNKKASDSVQHSIGASCSCVAT